VPYEEIDPIFFAKTDNVGPQDKAPNGSIRCSRRR
jgi:hypothetical protein